MVCLFWFTTFLLQTRHNDSDKRVLTVFLGTCTVLYLCHVLYFYGSLPIWGESLWALCSLSVYPLYYVYITHLTYKPLTLRQTSWCLLPGLLVAMAILLFPDGEADVARKILNTVQIVVVLYFGYKRLLDFDKEVAEVYADTENHETSAVRYLLVAFVVTSLLSVVANVLGKQYFASSDVLIMIVTIPFAVLLYAVSYLGYTRDFSREQFLKDISEANKGDVAVKSADFDYGNTRERIEALMGSGFYLMKNVKIGDVVNEAGICRTYVSNYINKTYGCSFSDYVNGLRIEHAQRLLRDNRDMKISAVSDLSGFASVDSFYRNFKKFTGKTPSDWLMMIDD